MSETYAEVVARYRHSAERESLTLLREIRDLLRGRPPIDRVRAVRLIFNTVNACDHDDKGAPEYNVCEFCAKVTAGILGWHETPPTG